MKNVLFLFALFFLIPASYGEFVDEGDALFLVGSTTASKLIKSTTEDFAKQSNIELLVRPIGSEKGIISIAEGVSDIGIISRFLTAEEIKKWPQISQITIAQDAIVFFVHKDNPINNLSHQAVIDIYTGKKLFWKGNSKKNINLFSKSIGHGTHDSFLKYFGLQSMPMQNNTELVFKTNSITTLFSTQPVKALTQVNQAVGNVYRNKKAMTYESLGAYKSFINAHKVGNLKLLKLDNHAPLISEKINPDYPFIRPINILVNENHSDSAQKYIDFLLSEKGQKALSKNHFIPVKKF